MRTCIHCYETKPIEAFTTESGYVRKKSCVECITLIREQTKDKHGTPTDFHRARNTKLVFDRLANSGGCAMCGDTRLAVLEFHHKERNTKSFNVSRRLAYSNTKSLTEEMNKCIVLCSNCHGIVTAIEDQTVRVSFITDEDMCNYQRVFLA